MLVSLYVLVLVVVANTIKALGLIIINIDTMKRPGHILIKSFSQAHAKEVVKCACKGGLLLLL